MRLPRFRSGCADEQVSSSGNLINWIAATRGTSLCCVVRSNQGSHLITRQIKSPPLVRRAFFEIGAGDEIRTHDILVGNEMLYH